MFSYFKNGIKNTIPKTGFPKFKRFDKTGRLCFQFQAPKARKPLTTARLFSTEDTRVNLRKEFMETPIFKNGIKIGTSKKEYVVATLNFGDKKIQVPFYMHRDLPTNVVVKWCYLVTRRVGLKIERKIQFIISRAEGFKKPCGNKKCAVDINWTREEDGLLVAQVGWKDDDEQKSLKLLLPQNMISNLKKTRELDSLVKTNFSDAKFALVQWIENNDWNLNKLNLPDWLQEKSEHLIKWESPNRLYELTKMWSSNRFEGDEEIFLVLHKWVERFRHLYDWSVNQKKKFCLRRDHLYRNFVSDLRKIFEKCYVEDINLAEMKKVPEPTQNLKSATRKNRDIASPGRFLELLKESISFEILDPRNTSKMCNACDRITNLSNEREYVCEYCGEKWDRHQNAAMNLLARGERLNSKNSK